MKFTAALVAFVAFVSHSSALMINTPGDVVQCEPIQFTWTAGQAPYYLSLLPAGGNGAAIKEFPNQNGTSFTWYCDLPANTQFTIALRDMTGAQAESSVIMVDTSSDSSCINTVVMDSGSGGMATATANAGNNVASTGTMMMSNSPAAITSSGITTVSRTSTASNTPLATTKSSASAAQGITTSAFGLCGLMAFLGTALF